MSSNENTAAKLLDDAKKQLDDARQAGQLDDMAEWTEIIAILEGRLPVARTAMLIDGRKIQLKSRLSFKDEMRVDAMFRRIRAIGVDPTGAHAEEMAEIALDIASIIVDGGKITKEMLTMFFTNDDIARIINTFVNDLQKSRERIGNFRPAGTGPSIHGPPGEGRDDTPPMA